MPNSVLVMDNAQIHHNGHVTKIVESRGSLSVYLPAYSLDLNPIEKGFRYFKSALRQYKVLLTGGQENYEVINKFFCLVFTGDMTKKLFRGCEYTLSYC